MINGLYASANRMSAVADGLAEQSIFAIAINYYRVKQSAILVVFKTFVCATVAYVAVAGSFLAYCADTSKLNSN